MDEPWKHYTKPKMLVIMDLTAHASIYKKDVEKTERLVFTYGWETWENGSGRSDASGVLLGQGKC